MPNETAREDEVKLKASKTWKGRPVYTAEDRKGMTPNLPSEGDWAEQLRIQAEKKNP